MADNTLHIYAQKQEHLDAYIVGSRVGLLALRNALTAALEDNKAAAAGSFCADGEGYTIIVIPVETAQLETLHLPYSKGSVSGNAKHPYDLLGTGQYLTLVLGT